jgi:hypothetical protein
VTALATTAAPVHPDSGEFAVVTEELTNTMPRSQPSLTWNMLLESGGVMISKEIELEIHLELVLTTPSDRPDPTRTASTPQ